MDGLTHLSRLKSIVPNAEQLPVTTTVEQLYRQALVDHYGKQETFAIFSKFPTMITPVAVKRLRDYRHQLTTTLSQTMDLVQGVSPPSLPSSMTVLEQLDRRQEERIGEMLEKDKSTVNVDNGVEEVITATNVSDVCAAIESTGNSEVSSSQQAPTSTARLRLSLNRKGHERLPRRYQYDEDQTRSIEGRERERSPINSRQEERDTSLADRGLSFLDSNYGTPCPSTTDLETSLETGPEPEDHGEPTEETDRPRRGRCIEPGDIVEPGRIYGRRDIPELLCRIYGRGAQRSFERDADGRSYLARVLLAMRETPRRFKCVEYFSGVRKRYQETLVSMRRNQQGRGTGVKGGEYELARRSLIADPYMDFATYCRLHKCMLQCGNIYEKTKDSLIPACDAVDQVVNVWIKGDAGVGKTRFVNWFVKYALDQRLYKVPHSQDYKWWDGYQGELCVHIEEMDPKQRMSISRLKDMLDVTPFKVEKKGSVTKDLRPVVFFITSNYYPEIVFGADWDAAMASRFSTERWVARRDRRKTWSQDLIWTVTEHSGFDKVYEKLKTLFKGLECMPDRVPTDFMKYAMHKPDHWVEYTDVIDL